MDIIQPIVNIIGLLIIYAIGYRIWSKSKRAKQDKEKQKTDDSQDKDSHEEYPF